MSPLAMDVLPWVGGLCAVFVIALALAVLVPHRRRQDAIDREIETRLMLGEDPDEIDRDIAQRTNTGPAPDAPSPHDS